MVKMRKSIRRLIYAFVIAIILSFFIWGSIMAEDCQQHEWIQGPFYLIVAQSYEEPNFYPPGAMTKIEHCKKCGLIRLPPDLREYDGVNLSQGKNTKKLK